MLATAPVETYPNAFAFTSIDRSVIEVAPMQEPVLRPGALTSLANTMGCDTPDMLIELIDTYVEESLQIVTGIKCALQEGSRMGVQQGAHSLKSSSAVMGACRLANVAEMIELGLRQNTLGANINASVELLIIEHGAASQALLVERQRLTS